MKILKKISETFFGQKFENTRVFPVATKIILIFAFFLITSNLISNYINLIFNRNVLLKQARQFLIKELKDIYSFCNNQFKIFEFNQELDGSIQSMEKKSGNEIKNQKSIVLGVKEDGRLFFEATKRDKQKFFEDKKSLEIMNLNRKENVNEGFMNITYHGEEYFVVYKFNPNWNIFLMKGEEINEFYEESREIFKDISVIIVIISLVSSVLGVFILRYILRFLRIMTSSIMKMSTRQELGMIQLDGAPSDDISFLGFSFNSLSSTINNMINIFKKFTNKDIVQKAYTERVVRLEGSQRELTCLFSDIKSFTFMTETLGTDIINLLNMHYDKAIKNIVDYDGIIGSIIGDALLAVYGVFQSIENKSYQSILSSYKIQEVAASLRENMKKKRDEIIRLKGFLSEEDEKIYKAVSLEVGVGIDGGVVFYGNIGSNDRMTNTVIGDNVNSASRLEGLTRIYKVPVICSEYVKDDILNNVENSKIRFIELDMVQVKGKTIGKKVYWPIFENEIDEKMNQELNSYQKGLELYFQGEWKKAYPYFKACADLPMTEVFIERTEENECPADWNGIWTMTSK